MSTPLEQWAARHGVPAAALRELAALSTHGQQFTDTGDAAEDAVQQRVRLAAQAAGMHLFRNNVGVLKNDEGRPVRYGLANDSKALNQKLKSGDLIGWRRTLITPEHVGTVIAQFASVECKHEGWHYTGGTERERAQLAWLQLVYGAGGYARFATGIESL